MSSLTQPLQPARALAGGSAARSLLAPLNGLVALLRSTGDAAMSRLHALRWAAQADRLRERAQRLVATNPGYAAELLAAADLLDAAADRA